MTEVVGASNLLLRGKTLAKTRETQGVESDKQTSHGATENTEMSWHMGTSLSVLGGSVCEGWSRAGISPRVSSGGQAGSWGAMGAGRAEQGCAEVAVAAIRQ